MEKEKFQFTIPGRPRPKERPRFTVGNLSALAHMMYNLFHKNPSISLNDFTAIFKKKHQELTGSNQGKIFTSQTTKQYESLVHMIAWSKVRRKITEEMITIEIKLYFADYKAGDVDNYAKSILDGMASIMDNDKQVKKIIVEKFLKEDEEGNEITKKEERAEIVLSVLDIPYNKSKIAKAKKESTKKESTKKSKSK